MPAESTAHHVPAQRRAWRRFRRNRLARSSAWFLGVVVGVSLSTLPFALRWYNVQELNQAVRHEPSLKPVVPYEHFIEAGPVGPAARITPGGQLERSTEARDPRGGPHKALDPQTPRGLKPAARAEREGEPAARGERMVTAAAHIAHAASSWLGHDDLGRSLLYRLLPGFLVSFCIALAAAGMAVLVGTVWGAVAALVGGRIDTAMMRIVDVLYGLPYILTVILLKIALTRPLTAVFAGHPKAVDLVILFIAIGGVSWLTMARVIRGQVLSLRAQPFIEAARAAGAGPGYILRRHILPHLVGPIVVYATLVVPQAILQESFLSFLGIGVQQPVPSLGRLAADGVEAVNTFVGFWWLIVFPAGLLVATLLALNFLGDGLRDAFDAKSSEATLL